MRITARAESKDYIDILTGTRLDGLDPLPPTARGAPDSNIERARAANACIAAGEVRGRGLVYPLDVPSAWLDYPGRDRNERLYQEARADLRRELGIIYRRDGRRFARIE